MDRFKKVIFGLLVSLLLGGCHKDHAPSQGRVKILSTTAQIGDLVEKIGGERVDSLVLIKGDLDPHSYEIVKGDMEKFQKADLVFYNGLGLEHGASLFSMLRNCPKAVAIAEEIRKARPEVILEKDGVVDPHIWMDISLWRQGIEPILKKLVEKDPEGACYYLEQAKDLELKMELAHEELVVLLQKIPSDRRHLVTSHDAFHYFTRSYLAEPGEIGWEERFAAPEGLAPEGQLNSRDIQKIIDFLKMKKVSVLFPESNVSRDAIRKIAKAGRDLGIEVRICQEPLYGDSMGGLGYLEMMQQNADTIARHLWNGQ